MAFYLNLAVNYLLRFLNLDFGAFLAQLKRSFQENFAKVEIQNSKQTVKKPYSKFQAKILKNVGCETFLVTAIW